jgi:peptidoglycan/xylan/chitin deacetylase (PgdA/CDA1 family)
VKRDGSQAIDGPLPRYYSSLRPFAELFRKGRPVLTYHHVRPRRAGARLKGLYVSPQLFARQLAELHQAGYTTPQFNCVVGPALTEEPCVFLTIDDGYRDVLENALPLLQQHRFRAILFLVPDLLGRTSEWQQRAGDIPEPLMDEAQVRDWLAAGQEIGSHTRSHPWLTQIGPESARREIFDSKKVLEDRFGVPIDHFCYPYGDWNETVRDLAIAAGYKTACTTRPGLNSASTSPFELKRFTARYPSRNLKALWARLQSALLR